MEIIAEPDGRRLAIRPDAVTVVGYSGRDRASVDAHIEELAAHGVAPPESVPAVWRLPVDVLTGDGVVAGRPEGTSGEAEPVLLRHDGEWYLAVGSDHTDRELEKTSMIEAKSACPKVVGPTCVRVDDVARLWDSLRLRSELSFGDGWLAYQDGTLGLLQPLTWYRSRFDLHAGDLVVFCGTVPTVAGLVTGAPGFRARLEGVDGEILAACQYELRTVGQTDQSRH